MRGLLFVLRRGKKKAQRSAETGESLLTQPVEDGIIKTNMEGKGSGMEPKDYTVVKIEGEYAYLRADGAGDSEDLFIAMALLPPGIDEGSRLHYEMLSYTRIS